jgi:hypothetical protein
MPTTTQVDGLQLSSGSRGVISHCFNVAGSFNLTLGCLIHPCTCHAAAQVDGLQLSSGSRGVNNGLWGVWLKNGADNLIRNFNAGSRLVRDIAVQGLQPDTVISNSECTWLCDVVIRALISV